MRSSRRLPLSTINRTGRLNPMRISILTNTQTRRITLSGGVALHILGRSTVHLLLLLGRIISVPLTRVVRRLHARSHLLLLLLRSITHGGLLLHARLGRVIHRLLDVDVLDVAPHPVAGVGLNTGADKEDEVDDAGSRRSQYS